MAWYVCYRWYIVINTGNVFAVEQDWGVQQKKANRSSEKNKKKLSAAVVESRLTNDISPESTPGAGRRRARTPHSFPHIKYTTQMSVPDQAELDKLRQRINFTDLDEVKSCCVSILFIYLFIFILKVAKWRTDRYMDVWEGAQSVDRYITMRI